MYEGGGGELREVEHTHHCHCPNRPLYSLQQYWKLWKQVQRCECYSARVRVVSLYGVPLGRSAVPRPKMYYNCSCEC